MSLVGHRDGYPAFRRYQKASVYIFGVRRELPLALQSTELDLGLCHVSGTSPWQWPGSHLSLQALSAEMAMAQLP